MTDLAKLRIGSIVIHCHNFDRMVGAAGPQSEAIQHFAIARRKTRGWLPAGYSPQSRLATHARAKL